MAIKVTDKTKEKKATEASLVHDWNYGDCGESEAGNVWVRVEYGALCIRSRYGAIVIFTQEELRDNKRKAIKDPDLSLELIFTRGK